MCMSKDKKINEMKERLQQELTAYKPVPFWSWNDKLEPEELCRQIDWMQENGIGGFFMHARSGLKTEYLSEEWMQCIQTCAERAAQLGMEAWAYDENGWPSGFAGGKLLEDPANRDCYILSSTGAYDPAATVSYSLAGNALRRVSSGEADGEYLNLYIRTAVSTADILNPDVVDRFIALTHEAYRERFGDAFSDKICGFFTDEPQYQRAHTPFTNVLYRYYKEQYGEDILDGLGLLFAEKDGYRRFRYRYWKTMQHLMLESFAKKIYHWCHEHRVRFTGHYIEEGSLSGQMLCCAGIMPFYAYMDMPGIDWLGSNTNNVVPPRQLASVAAQLGKKHTLTETFACCGWQISPREIKRIGDFQFLGGVNRLCHHLIPYAENGQRKKDYPAHYSPVNPWVEREFADFNRYYTRLGQLLSESEEAVNVAVLHPIRSAYLSYRRDVGGSLSALDQNLFGDCRLLTSSGISFHFLDETLLAEHGFARGGKIGCGEKSYDFLVLPHILAMDASTERLLRQYVAAGGKLLILGDVPACCEGEDWDFSYLSSNCTLEEIMAAQPFRMEPRSADIYVYNTYRVWNGQPFMMLQNGTPSLTHTVTYHLGDGIRSFRKLDLLTMETKNIPLMVTLEPGESMVVFPDTAEPDAEPDVQEYRFRLKDAAVSCLANLLTVDYVSYSVDGIQYSKRYPCAGLFAKLLKERYTGQIYLKYEFEVRTVPAQLRLAAEDCHATQTWINGMPIVFTDCSPKEKKLRIADIADKVHVGLNEYVIQLNWFQSESVYYALFGENVTESLRNCLVYDTELEPIYLSGSFGVYSETGFTEEQAPRYLYGDRFYIGAMPETVTEPVTDGFPFFAGELTVVQDITLETERTALRIEGTWHVAYVTVNGQYAGKLVFDRVIDIRPYAVRGRNRIEIRFIIGNRNLLGPHHNSGTDVREMVGPSSFSYGDSWEDGVNPQYSDRYGFIKLGCD